MTIRQVERLFQKIDRDPLKISLEIHNLVAEIAPSAAVNVHRRGLTYFHAERGGHVSAGICQTFVMPDYIPLAFIHGACIPNPKQLFEGKTYPERFLRIDSYDNAPWDNIRQLITEHAAFDPYTSRENG